MNKTAVIFGAGNIGRGFIAQLFNESAYEVIFIDLDKELLEALNERGQYCLQIVDNDFSENKIISPVRAIDGNNSAAVAEALLNAEIAASAVGANALKYIAANIAKGISLRAQNNAAPFNFIVCENLHSAAKHLRTLVEEYIPVEAKEYFEKKMGFVDTVIGRMVPVPTAEMRQEDVSLIKVEAYKELPVDKKGFVGEIPEISAMTAYDDFEVFTARKLYIHNCGHALMAYAGFQRNYEFGYEAMADEELKNFMLAGLRESSAAISKKFNASESWLKEHVDKLMLRFNNKVLGDKIFRLGKDPIRKLALDDRLTGAAKLAQSQGLPANNLAWGMALALHFNPDDDPEAQKLQELIKEKGPAKALQEVSAVPENDPLNKLVVKAYEELKINPRGLGIS